MVDKKGEILKLESRPNEDVFGIIDCGFLPGKKMDKKDGIKNCNNFYGKMEENYALYFATSGALNDTGNISCMVNKKYRSERVASTEEYFRRFPHANNVHHGLTCLTVCVERSFLLTFEYLNVHGPKKATKKSIHEGLFSYVHNFEGLSPLYTNIIHPVQGDFNPTSEPQIFAEFNSQIKALGFTALKPQHSSKRKPLDFTFCTNQKQVLGGTSECGIFDVTFTEEHKPLFYTYMV